MDYERERQSQGIEMKQTDCEPEQAGFDVLDPDKKNPIIVDRNGSV
jgi:hypothetical protein